MSQWNKWIAGALGWAMGGPIGGIIGFALGAISEDAIKTSVVGMDAKKAGKGVLPNDFSAALLVLCAAVMKADNRLLKTELDFIRQFFTRQFGIDHANQRMLLLREILKQQIPLADVCEQIKHNIDSSSRLQLLHLLFGLAAADGHVNADEMAVIKDISWRIGISDRDYISLQNMFVRETDSCYKILEIEKTASVEEIKKAYRRMAMKYHPDKVHHLGPEYQKDAQEKFRKINEAYEQIKSERGIT
jgi:DnaJ like chaperone protein